MVLDNLLAHRSPQVDKIIASAYARVLRLPAYSPDFNPIKVAIAKMKSLLRRESRRHIAGLYQVLGLALQSITPQHATNFIRHGG